MRVLIADKLEQSAQDGLKSCGCDVSYQPGLKDEALAAEVERYRPDVLVVRSTKVPAMVLNAGALKLVVRAGAGYNTIDVDAASRRGIYISNCPGKNSIAVAELAFGLILALDRRIADNVIALRQGQWNKAEFSKARGLHGRTLGIVGLGQIGKQMIARGKAFGMNVIGWSRHCPPDAAELDFEWKATLPELAAEADVVSIHVALNSESKGMIGAEFFNAMRNGAYFINTSRAEVVDQAALAKAVREKGIRAGLDVFAGEPASGTGEFKDDIVQSCWVYGTHHIGASTDQAQEAIAAETVRIVKTFKETGKVPNVVNLAASTPATCALVIRHLDRPGVLASVLDAIRGANINVQEMENIIFEGAQAAVARINLETTPETAFVEQIQKSNENIIEMSLIPLS